MLRQQLVCLKGTMRSADSVTSCKEDTSKDSWYSFKMWRCFSEVLSADALSINYLCSVSYVLLSYLLKKSPCLIFFSFSGLQMSQQCQETFQRMQGIFYTLLFFLLYIRSMFILCHMLHSKGWIIQVVHQDMMGT